nr:hypothetical protein CFP56_02091 [Quercus suber]
MGTSCGWVDGCSGSLGAVVGWVDRCGFFSSVEQGKDLDEFFQSTAGKFQTELGKAWALEIASRRRKEG